VLGRVQSPEQARHLLQPFQLVGVGQVPDGLRVEGGLGHEQGDEVDLRSVSRRLALVTDDLLGDRDAAEEELETEAVLAAKYFLDRRLRLLLRLRVPVATEGLDERRSRSVVELANA